MLKAYLVIMVLFIIESITAQNRAPIGQYEIETLKLVDVSGDSILNVILNDATDNVKYGNRPAYYSVWMDRYKEGTIIRIIRSRKDMFDKRPNILGYTVVNNCPIVFYKGVTNYPVKYAVDHHPLHFKLGSFDYCDDSEDVKYYYILADIYARFSREVGWIWSDGKPDE